MAFESLTEKLQNVFKNLRSKGRLTEDDINAAMDAQWSEMKSYEEGGSGWMVVALLLLAIAISAFNIWRKLRKKSRDNY